MDRIFNFRLRAIHDRAAQLARVGGPGAGYRLGPPGARMTAALIKWGLIGLAIAAAIAAIVIAYNNWHDDIEQAGVVKGRKEVKAQWDQDVIARQAAATTALARVRKEEQDAAAAAAKNAKVEYANEKAQAVAIARSGAVSVGMSRYIADLNASAIGRGLPTPAACPAEFVRERDDAIRARTALDQCSSRYREVAADGDAVDLKLDTALRYIAVVVPAASEP